MKTKKSEPEKTAGGRQQGGAKGQKAVVNAKYAKHAKKQRHELDGQDACPTTGRRKLVSILGEYDVSVTGFDGLRADTYEKHLARQSLTKLAAFYARLLNTCEHYQKIQKQCLPWGDGSDDQGKLPSVRTLTVIKERILTERRLAEMAPRLKALAQVARSLTGLPVAERAVVLQGMQALIAAELMGLVGNGKRVLDHLPAVDRVIRAVSAQARVEQSIKRNELAEKALEIRRKEWELRKSKGEVSRQKPEARMTQVECKDTTARGDARPTMESGSQNGSNAGVDPDFGLTEDEKTDRLLERAFGKPPEDETVYEPQPVTGTITKDQNENNPQISQIDTDSKEPQGPGDTEPNDETGVPPRASEVEDEYNKPNLPNGKPWWWQPGTILISGPSKECPKGIGRDVVTNLPYCVATGRPAYLATK